MKTGRGAEGKGLAGLLLEGPRPGPAGRQIVLLVFRLALAATFIYAALQKMGKPLLFADEIEMYGMLGPGPMLYILAIALPWIELACGLSLLSGLCMRGAALILALMNVVFIVVISYRTAGIMSAEGTPLTQVFFDCGCGFGPTYAWKKLIEDAVLLVFAISILVAPGYRFVIGERKG